MMGGKIFRVIVAHSRGSNNLFAIRVRIQTTNVTIINLRQFLSPCYFHDIVNLIRVKHPQSRAVIKQLARDLRVDCNLHLAPGFFISHPHKIPMLPQFLIASAVVLQAVASESYYCDSGEAMCCSNITTSSVSSRDILTSYSISDSDLSELVGIGCEVIAAVGDVSDCVNETVCCTGPVYYEGEIAVNCTAAMTL